MALIDDFRIVRPACDFSAVLPAESAVQVKAGVMHASNARLTIAHPTKLPDFTVAGVELDFALRYRQDPKVNVTPSNLVLDGKTRIGLLPEIEVPEKPPVETHEIADIEDLLEVVDEILPFTIGNSARLWTFGARFDDCLVTATDAAILIQAELAQSSGFEGLTLSREALEYIRLRSRALTRWGANENGVLLEFDDGGWAFASAMEVSMPDNVVSITQSVNDWDMPKLSNELRDALEVAISFTEEDVFILPDRVVAKRWASVNEEAVKTGISEEAVYDSKRLAIVLKCAEAIGFDRYPGPAPFVTKRGSRGLIASKV